MHVLYIKAHICNNHAQDYLSKARLCIIYTPRHVYVIDTQTMINYIQYQYVVTVEPSGVQALKNPNPLKHVEALAELVVAVLF